MKMAQTVKPTSQQLIVRLTPDSQQIFYRNDNPILITNVYWVAQGNCIWTAICHLIWSPLLATTFLCWKMYVPISFNKVFHFGK